MAVGYSTNSDYNYSLDVTSETALTGSYSDLTATLKEGKKMQRKYSQVMQILKSELIRKLPTLLLVKRMDWM